jgi:MFS family permease
VKRLLGYRAYVWFWAASTVSAFGDPVTAIALQVLVVVTLHGSATNVGLLNGARWLPYAVAGLVVGALVDRYPRQPILVGSDLARGVLLGAIPLLALVGMLQIPVLVAFMVAFGSLSLVNDAAFQSYLPRLVPRPLLARANARLDQGGAVAQTSGPALAGGLVALLGAPLAVLTDAASYVLSGLLLMAGRPQEPHSQPGHRQRRGLSHEVAEGLAWVYRHRMLAPLAISTHTWFLFSGILGAVFAPFALRAMQVGALGLGVTFALAGIGGLLGSLLSGPVGRSVGVGRTVVVARVVEAFAVALAALAGTGADPWIGWTMLGGAQFLLGLGMGVQNPHEMGYRQAVTPDRMQGRMNATMRSLNRAMIVVGGPLGGLFADTIGYRPALWLTASGFLIGAIFLWVSPFRHAEHSDAVDSMER